MKFITHTKLIALVFSLILILFVWSRNNYSSLSFDSDMGRDLKEISNIYLGKVVWLGPWLNPGLHASSFYYYFFFPALILLGGTASGFITYNIFLALLSMGIFGLYGLKKYGYKALIFLSTLSLLPMVTDNILHFGNGYTYIFFIIGALSALWFELPFFVGSFLAGIAISFHPAAGVLLIFLVYEAWKRKEKIWSLFLSAIAFLVPLSPLLVFEVITKGYIVRNFLAHPATGGVTLQFSLNSFQTLSSLLGLSPFFLLFFIVMSGYFGYTSSSKKLKVWYSITLFFTLFVLFFDGLIGRYLFGVALLLVFTFSVSFLEQKKGMVLLTLFSLLLFFQSPLFYPSPLVERTFFKIEKVADFIHKNHFIDRSQKVAVVSATTKDTEVPQADDYRFLLRMRGYTVMETQDNSQADKLLMVIEADPFDWQSWSNWEIEQFGNKKVEKIDSFDGITVIVFSKE